MKSQIKYSKYLVVFVNQKNCKTHIEEVSIDVVRPRYTVNRVQKHSGVIIYRARV